MNRLTKSVAGLMLALSAFSFSSCDDDSNVIGLNNATKYGYIKVILEGTDPNGDAFEVTRNFRFSPSGSPQYTSSVYTYDDDGYYQEIDVVRYLGTLNGGDGDDSYADLYIRHEEETNDFDIAELDILTAVTTDNKQFFTLDEEVDFTEEDVTAYSYNPENGKLALKFSKVLEQSSTGSPLTVTANINVIVFENLTPVFNR